MSIEAKKVNTWLKALILLLPFILCDCGSPPPSSPPRPNKPRRIHHSPTPAELKIDEAIQYQPDAYILHLSLAELALDANPSDMQASAADFDIARSYSMQGQSGTVLQPVITIEYALSEQKNHKFIIIPFTMPQENSDFPALEDVLDKLNEMSYTVYDLRLAVIKLTPPEPLGEEGQDAASAQKMAQDRLLPFVKQAAHLPPMAQARVYLQLARFFMQHKAKEPAYLSIENAKQALASVEGSPAALESTRGLTHEIDAEEAQLHKTMPFTLNF